eukprot:CAMPEP_0169465224 /NCGR_PEP_ID=MMETSP1042-20121227/21095_1 /TAXON_ID=464988 /ORGANISM="Hemiselmis andersenii, Strain CCMP1180" /LENGTH=40 /DNA_ID= /DNA_START= /DNA_END= /DNA_ORIENTATION=
MPICSIIVSYSSRDIPPYCPPAVPALMAPPLDAAAVAGPL